MRQQAAANAKAAAAQAEMDRIAREREAMAAEQQAQMQKLQSEQAAAAVAQKERTSALQAQQVQRTAEINASGQAVTSSLQILGDSGGKQGPTAAMAPKVKGRVSASSSNPTGLRIGSTMTGSGVGTNLGT